MATTTQTRSAMTASATKDSTVKSSRRALSGSADVEPRTGALKARVGGTPLESKKAVSSSLKKLSEPRTSSRAPLTPTPISKLPQSTLSKRVSRLGLSAFSSSKPTPTAPTTAIRTRKLAIAPSTPGTKEATTAAAPPVTAIRVRKPALPRPASVAGSESLIPAQRSAAGGSVVRKHARTSSVQVVGSPKPVLVKTERRAVEYEAAPRTSTGLPSSSTLASTNRQSMSMTQSAEEAAPARRSTRLAKTSSGSTISAGTNRTPTKAKSQSNTLPNRQSSSYASPPCFDFLKQDPNHSTPQRPPKTSTQPYEDLKARWRRNNDANGSPGMLLSDSPIGTKLVGDVVSLDEMDDTEVEMEMLRKELEGLRAEVEGMDAEKAKLVLDNEKLGGEIQRGREMGWMAILEMAEMALEEELADQRVVDAGYTWLVTFDDLATRMTT